MLDKVLKLSQKPVLDELGLQEASFVDGTVEEALETDVPEEIVAVFLREKVLGKLAGEVGELLPEHSHCPCLRVLLDLGCQSAVEEPQVVVVLLKQKIEDARILLCELGVSELGVRDGFSVYVRCRLLVGFALPVQGVGVLDHHVQPQVLLYLLHHVRELACCNALNGSVLARERHKEVDNTFRDSGLLPPLVDVLALREVEEDFRIGIVLVLGLGHRWLEGWVNQKDRPDAHLLQSLLHLCSKQ